VRVIRLISVVLGVGLIVAVVAVYVSRTTELSRERDLPVETAADLAVVELDATAGVVDAVAEFSTTPDRAVAALSTQSLGGDACAIVLGDTVGADAVCADSDGSIRSGVGLDGDAGFVGVLEALVDETFSDPVVDGTLVFRSVGPDVAIAAAVPIERLALSSRVSTSRSEGISIDVVEGGGPSGVSTVGDRREVSRALSGAPGWAVVASAPEAVELAPADRTGLALLFGQAVLLLLLCGITLVADRRHLVERASLDPLTRLPNRGEFERRGETLVETAVRGGEGVCLMLVDLDGFKAINDTHGHHAGDEILKVVGMRLRNAVRGYDLVARWGGDEFVIVLQGIDNEVFATSRAAGLAALVTEPLRSDDAAAPRLQVGASVGIALLGPHGESLTELVEAADAAMYEAKRAGEPYRVAAYAGSRAVLDPA
jgi:diguanylate cyclase (GGDEF)-like protein